MTNNKDYTPALGYDWLSSFYDLTIKLTMPEQSSGPGLLMKLTPGIMKKYLKWDLEQDRI